MKIVTFDAQGLHEVDETDFWVESSSSNQIVWIDINMPTPDVMRGLQQRFQFHSLAIEDTLNQRQRPKVDEYADHLLIITNHIMMVEKTLEFEELDIFLGHHYIVTVHQNCNPIIREAYSRIQRSGFFKHVSSEYLLYIIMDTIVDAYFPIIGMIDDEVEDLGEVIIRKPSPKHLERMMALKRMLNETWHVMEQQQSMFSILTRREEDLLTNRDVLDYYLRDVHDHLIRIATMTSMLRDNLTSIVELYMSAVSYRLNLVVNRLTVVTITIGIFTVFSGFYGMNFTHTWPSFDAEWGVPFVITVMSLLSLTAIVIFKRMRWF